MTEFTWNPEWGDRDEYEFLPDTELEGFRLGQHVTVLEDLEDDESDERGYFSGDDGTVIGVAFLPEGLFNDNPRKVLYVAFEGMDPCQVEPEHLERF
jgi:hypothetical protein